MALTPTGALGRWTQSGKPLRLRHRLGVTAKHDVEPKADARATAAVWVHRVLQPSGKQQQHTILHLEDDLLGVLSSQFSDRRADDPGLRPRIEEIDAIGTWVRPHVVDAAQEIVWMVMRPVPSTRAIYV